MGNAHHAGKEKGIKPDDDRAAQQSGFFRNYGKNEVRLRHRQKLKLLLSPFKEAFPQDSPGADSHLGLPHLIIPRQAHDFRMKESVDPVLLMARHEAVDDRDGEDSGCRHSGIELSVHAGRKDHDDRNGQDDQGIAQIVLHHGDDPHKGQDIDSRVNQAFEGSKLLLPAAEVGRQNDDKGNLYDFRRLQIHGAKIDPGPCPVHFLSDLRQENREKKKDRSAIKDLFHVQEQIVIEKQDDAHQKKTDPIGGDLDLDHAGKKKSPVIGGAADGQDADRRENQGDQEQNDIYVFEQFFKILQRALSLFFLTVHCFLHYNI